MNQGIDVIATDQVGSVKWWNRARGIGFIVSQDGSPDVFVHYSAIQGGAPGRCNLTEHQRVMYDLVDRGKGPAAVRVRPLHD